MMGGENMEQGWQDARDVFTCSALVVGASIITTPLDDAVQLKTM